MEIEDKEMQAFYFILFSFIYVYLYTAMDRMIYLYISLDTCKLVMLAVNKNKTLLAAEKTAARAYYPRSRNTTLNLDLFTPKQLQLQTMEIIVKYFWYIINVRVGAI